MHPGCETCNILVDRLAEATKRLDRAALRLRSLIGAKKPEEFAAVFRESKSVLLCGNNRELSVRERA